jgi:3-methyladenine DNA glycosylase AlkD
LGVRVPILRKIAKGLGTDHDLALALWDTGIIEARTVASIIADPAQMTGDMMDTWVADLDAWDICDQVCMNLFEKTPLAWTKIGEWSTREEEFVRRAAYALLACLAWHDKTAPDQAFIDLLPVIRAGAGDGRNFVKKAVSWALRNIGKRNQNLHTAALALAHQLGQSHERTSRWIANDVIRDLNTDATKRRLAKS